MIARNARLRRPRSGDFRYRKSRPSPGLRYGSPRGAGCCDRSYARRVPTTLLWFRRDLRLGDHPALLAARDAAGPDGDVLPVFVFDDRLYGPSGEPRRRFLLDCLSALDGDLDGALVLRSGDPAEVLPALAREVDATSVHISADAGPYGRRRDDRGRGGAGRGAAGPHRLALPGHPRPGHQARRHPLPGLHAFLPRLARARLARPRGLPRRRPLAHRRPLRGPAAGARPGRRRPAAGRRGGRAGRLGAVPRRAAARLRRGAQPPRHRRHQPAVGLPEVRLHPPAHARRRPGRRAVGVGSPLHRRAGLAGLLRRRAVAPPRLGAGVPQARAAGHGLRQRPGGRRAGARLGDRPHRVPDRRRRDAPAARRGATCTTGCG